MTPLEIKIALMKAGITQAEIARKRKVSPALVCLVIKSKLISTQVMQEIAKAINKDVAEIWPDYFSKKKPARQ